MIKGHADEDVAAQWERDAVQELCAFLCVTEDQEILEHRKVDGFDGFVQAAWWINGERVFEI